jgi:hypothetical protein
VAFLPGVALTLFGVAGLRTMARRSVSLRALRAIRDGNDPRERFDVAMLGRVEELDRFGLAQVRERRFVVTPSGRRVLAAVRVLRSMAGVRLGAPKVQTRAGRVAAVHVAIAAPLLVVANAWVGIDPLALMLFLAGTALSWFVVRSHLESSVLFAMLEEIEAGCGAPDELLRRFQPRAFEQRLDDLHAAGLVDTRADERCVTAKGSLVLRLFAWLGAAPELTASGVRIPSRTLR